MSDGSIPKPKHPLESQKQQARAEANFKLARSTVDEYFTQVSENTLLNQPGMQPLQQELLGQALQYYQQFLTEHADDPDIQDDLAGAYFRVGLINETVEADPAASTGPLEQALEIQKQLVNETPDDLSRQAALADTLTALGRVRFRSTGPESSLAALRQALEIREVLATEDGGTEFHRVVANSSMNLGLVYKSLGDVAAAREQFERAQARRRELLEATDDLRVLRDLGMGHYNLGNLALEDSSAAANEAFAHFTAAIEVFSQVVAAEPEDFSNQSRLALCYRILGDQLSGGDQPSEALDSYKESREILQNLAGLNPQVTQYREQLAGLEMNRGHLLVNTGDSSLAWEAFGAARDLWKVLWADDSDVSIGRNYAITLRELALIEAEPGDTSAGRAAMAKAETILHDLAEKNPGDEELRLDLEDTSRLHQQLASEGD